MDIKRILLNLAVFLFIMCAVSYGITVSIPNTAVNPGTTTVQIPINIDNANGVAGFQFTVSFDNSVLNATGAIAGSLTGGWFLQVNPQQGQIGVAGVSSTELGSVSGSLCILQFNVVGTPADSTNLNFTVHKLSNFQAQEIAHNATNGTFHINGYSISGTVNLVGGAGQVTQVQLTLEPVIEKTTTNPDAQGNYSFTDIAPHTYIITPQLAGYTFNPVNRQVTVTNANVTGQNFTGNALCSVSGTISYSGAQQGTIYIGLFTSPDFLTPSYATQIANPGEYNIMDVSPATYYAAAFMDVNGNQQWDQATEPLGVYSGNPFTLSAGQNKTGVNITLKEPLILQVFSAFGSPNPSVGQHPYYTGDIINASVNSPVSGDPGTRYVCTGWTGTGSVPASGTTTNTTFTINQNSTITWNWKTQYLLTYSADPAAGGTVTVNPQVIGNWYDENTQVTLTQNLNQNYVFLYWLVDGVENHDEPLILTMNAPHTVVAKYALNQPVLDINPTTVQFYLNNSDPTTKETDIVIKNVGSGPGTLDWQINPANIIYQQGTGWIAIQQNAKNGIIQGRLPSGQQETIILQVNRQGLQIGEYNATIPVSSNGGDKNISVKMIINEPPEAQALNPSGETTVETAIEFNAKFTSNGGTIAKSEWKIYSFPQNKTLTLLKTITVNGSTNKIILPFSLFKLNEPEVFLYHWTVQCWDSYGEPSDIDEKDFLVNTKVNLPITTVDSTKTETVYLVDSTSAETKVFVTLSTVGKIFVRPLKIADFPGTSSIFAGLFDIRVENIQPGATALIIFDVPGTVSGWFKYRYNNDTQQWEIKKFPADDTQDEYAILGPSDRSGYTQITIQLKDGGEFDADGQENGIISDPSGYGTGGEITQVSGGGGGCFIATAAFGSYQEKHVWILRQFRDKYLLTNPAGRAFIKWYYKHSPKYASIIAQNEALRTITRTVLMPVYAFAFLTLKIGMFLWLFIAGMLLVVLTKRGENA